MVTTTTTMTKLKLTNLTPSMEYENQHFAWEVPEAEDTRTIDTFSCGNALTQNMFGGTNFTVLICKSADMMLCRLKVFLRL